MAHKTPRQNNLPGIVPRGSIRLSLNGDVGSAIRNAARDTAFRPNGFFNAAGAEGTGTWINWGCTPTQMACALTTLWALLSKDENKSKIDHVWSNYEHINLGSIKSHLEEIGIIERQAPRKK